MDILQLQEKRLFQQLCPVFDQYGYEAIPSKKQFCQINKSGFRSVGLSLSSGEEKKTIEIQLSIRNNLVEELVHQFLGSKKGSEKDSTTISLSLARLKCQKQPNFVIAENDQDLQLSGWQIAAVLHKKGFHFLNTFSKLHRIDKMVNRKPSRPSPLMPNQIHRCFKGIIIARMLHRTNFEKLANVYGNYLCRQLAPRQLTDNYYKLLSFLKNFSFN